MTSTRIFMISLSVATLLVASSAVATIPADRTSFDTAPVSTMLLAASHGTGNGYRVDFATMVEERARTDQQTFAAINQVSMDAWWAYNGSLLIASNLR